MNNYLLINVFSVSKIYFFVLFDPNLAQINRKWWPRSPRKNWRMKGLRHFRKNNFAHCNIHIFDGELNLPVESFSCQRHIRKLTMYFFKRKTHAKVYDVMTRFERLIDSFQTIELIFYPKDVPGHRNCSLSYEFSCIHACAHPCKYLYNKYSQWNILHITWLTKIFYSLDVLRKLLRFSSRVQCT